MCPIELVDDDACELALSFAVGTWSDANEDGCISVCTVLKAVIFIELMGTVTGTGIRGNTGMGTITVVWGFSNTDTDRYCAGGLLASATPTRKSALRIAGSPSRSGHLTHVCTHAINSACKVAEVPGGNAWARGPVGGGGNEQVGAPQHVCPDLKKK